MTFAGIQIHDSLAGYKFKQTPNQAYRNIIEIDGIEFSMSFVIDYPTAVKNIIEGECSRKESLRRYHLDMLRAMKSGGMSGGTKATETVIPLAQIAQLFGNPNRGRHLQVILTMLHTCMTEGEHSAAYYCSKPIAVIKSQFLKALTDLCIEDSKYDAHSFSDEIRFTNDSRIVFVCSAAVGGFHIVAPNEPNPFIGIDLARYTAIAAEVPGYAKYMRGIWFGPNP